MSNDVPWREHHIHHDGSEADEGADDFHLQLFAPPDDPFRTFEYSFPVTLADGGGTSAVECRLRGQEEHTSTGLALWSGSLMLARHLADHPDLVRGRRVLELGAGMGLCGIVAHKLGCRDASLTDGDAKVLDNLRYNVRTNVPPASSHGGSPISCPQLIWGQGLDEFMSQRFHGGERYDVIMASDVGYMTKSLDPLWRTIDRCLEATGGGMFIYVGECSSQDSVEHFLNVARRFKFTWTVMPDEVYIFRRKM